MDENKGKRLASENNSELPQTKRRRFTTKDPMYQNMYVEDFPSTSASLSNEGHSEKSISPVESLHNLVEDIVSNEFISFVSILDKLEQTDLNIFMQVWFSLILNIPYIPYK